MASVAEIRLPAGEVCLERTVANTTARFSALRSVDHGIDRRMPFVRATGDEAELDAVADSLPTDPTVERAACIASMDGDRLYRIEWTDGVEGTIERLLEGGGGLLDARTTPNGGWWFRLFCSDRRTISETYENCLDCGLSIDIDRIYDLDGRRYQRFGLTAEQHETIRVAFERGYYDVPRKVTLTELAETIGISHQALSERLRRGHRSLVENVVGTGSSGTDTGTGIEIGVRRRSR